jgi:formate dehydrogenase subunit gamma
MTMADWKGRAAPYAWPARLVAAIVVLLLSMSAVHAQQGSSVRPPAGVVESSVPPSPPGSGSPSSVRPGSGAVIPPPDNPTADKGAVFDNEMWRRIRGGLQGTVSIPDKKAGQLVQSDGELWRNLRNGPLPTYGAWAMAGIVGLLALFFLVRGRIRIEHGWAGRTITRFTDAERMGHWLLATSFIILALTGLNVMYGRYVVLPFAGKETFATLTIYGKWLHNYVAFAFIVGLILTFVMWVVHNLPNWRDIVWLLRGGGMFVKDSHPPAWKFNAGQKILFWLVMLGGLSISLSGISLMFPFQVPMFAKTFAVLNMFALDLPTSLSPVQEMQYATTWHGIVALGLIVVIIAHIYIGTLGMEGAFSAMGTGEVDVNWAKEHHSLWAEDVLSGWKDAEAAARPMPAE